jgi:Transposase IS66 family
VLISIAPRWPVGLARPANCSRRSLTRSGSMFWRAPRSTPTTRPFRCLHRATGRPKTGRLWTYVRGDRPAGYTTPPAVWFAYSEDRKGEHPRRHLKDFKGGLQADAYSGLHHLYGDGVIFEVSCWSHARRKFHDIHVAHPSPTTTEALDRIAENGERVIRPEHHRATGLRVQGPTPQPPP